MGTANNLLRAAGLGAALMYFYDPQLGRRRRATLRDGALGASHRASHWLDVAIRDAQNRLEGTAAEFQSLFDSEAPSDETLQQRVRAKLGHVASHPHLIEVRAENGRVTLAGHSPAHETRGILSAVGAVRGVCSVDNRLDAEMPPEARESSHPHPRGTWQAEMLDYAWPPAKRLFAGLTGGLLMLNCMARRTPAAMLLGTLGFGMFLKAAQRPLKVSEREPGDGRFASSAQRRNQEADTAAQR